MVFLWEWGFKRFFESVLFDLGGTFLRSRLHFLNFSPRAIFEVKVAVLIIRWPLSRSGDFLRG